MKVLLVLKEGLFFERLGVMCLSSALKERGYQVKLTYATNRDIRTLVKSFAPQIIGFSAMSGEFEFLRHTNEKLKKEFSFISVFGGAHATFSPEIISDPAIDAICIGEGDIAFPEFCSRIEKNGPYWETENFHVKYLGEIHRNPLGLLVDDLDSLPLPDRGIMYSVDAELRDSRHKLFMSSRGCPYKCSYCFNDKYNEIYKGKGDIVRSKTPEGFISEIVQIMDSYPLDYVYIADDTFTLKPNGWIQRFVELYLEFVKLPMLVNFRASSLKEEDVRELARAGLDSAYVGVECGDEEISNTILRRNTSNKKIIDACRILSHYRIKFITFNLLALPVEHPFEIDLKTLDLNIQLRPTFAYTSLVFPFSGTALHSYSKSKGYLPADYSILNTSRRSSVFNYNDPKEKMMVENLQKVFAVTVNFPFLRSYVVSLCKMPFPSLFNAFNFLYQGYVYKFKIWPWKDWKEVFRYFSFFIRTIKKT